jgi:hypothetical protein
MNLAMVRRQSGTGFRLTSVVINVGRLEVLGCDPEPARDYRHVLQFPVATVITYHHSFSGPPSGFSKADARTSPIFADELDSGGFYRPLKLSTRLVRYSRPKTSFEALHSRDR